ncbi:MAG: GH25 family lysozyme, partial [Bacteroidota bacterium]
MQSNSKGIDVSHFQCDLDWSALKNEGISFAFVKATEGETYVDPCFHKNWANGQKEGLKLAPYHFYRSKDNPGKQADLFIKTVKVITDRLDMAPALDIEMETAPISHEQFADDILQWLKRVE